MIIVTPRGPVRLLDVLATAIWDPILSRAGERAGQGPARTGAGSTNHRAPITGARTSWEVAAAGSAAVAQHFGTTAAASLPAAALPGTPWPVGRGTTRAQGSGHPLHAPLRPGTSDRCPDPAPGS